MKIEFLGHGIFEEQNNTVGNYLHKSFKDKILILLNVL